MSGLILMKSHELGPAKKIHSAHVSNQCTTTIVWHFSVPKFSDQDFEQGHIKHCKVKFISSELCHLSYLERCYPWFRDEKEYQWKKCSHQCSHLFTLFAMFDDFKKMNCSPYVYCSLFARFKLFVLFASFELFALFVVRAVRYFRKNRCSLFAQRTVRTIEQRTRLFAVRWSRV